MAQEEQTANDGTGRTPSGTPKWDSYNGEMYPFLSLNEELKRAGFKVTFLTDKPRKETVNSFNTQLTDFWFDVVYDGEPYTWTVSQVSLILELQKHKPLKDKTFYVKLVPVSEVFKKQFPKYKGKDRYEVTPVEAGSQHQTVTTSADSQERRGQRIEAPASFFVSK